MYSNDFNYILALSCSVYGKYNKYTENVSSSVLTCSATSVRLGGTDNFSILGNNTDKGTLQQLH